MMGAGADTSIGQVTSALLAPSRLFSVHELLNRPSPVPRAPGIYAWYFDEVPASIPTAGLHSVHGLNLLYTGISPKRPRSADGRASKGTLHSRIRFHLRGNASQSTLRTSLGSLLRDKLDIALQRTGPSKRLTYGSGESVLTDWLKDHAYVCWAVCQEPWEVESQLIATIPLRLNLDQNKNDEFHTFLTRARADQRASARSVT
jgi:hypothetical protein